MGGLPTIDFGRSQGRADQGFGFFEPGSRLRKSAPSWAEPSSTWPPAAVLEAEKNVHRNRLGVEHLESGEVVKASAHGSTIPVAFFVGLLPVMLFVAERVFFHLSLPGWLVIVGAVVITAGLLLTRTPQRWVFLTDRAILIKKGKGKAATVARIPLSEVTVLSSWGAVSGERIEISSPKTLRPYKFYLGHSRDGKECAASLVAAAA